MDIVFIEERRINLEFDSFAFDIVQRDFCRFLHDVAQLTGDNEFALPVEVSDLNRQDIAAEGRIGQTGYHADLIFFLLDAVFKLFFAQPFHDQLLRDLD